MKPRRFALPLVASSIAGLILLSGCAQSSPVAQEGPPPAATASPVPSQTPSPSPSAVGVPALGELVLSPDGLGTVQMGQAPTDDHETSPLIYVDDYCQEAVDIGAITDPGKWIPNYEPALSGDTRGLFSALVADGKVNTLSINDERIRTAEGLGLGSSEKEITAAFPDVRVLPSHEAQLLVVDGSEGYLVFETIGYEPAEDDYAGQYDKGEAVMVRVYANESDIRGWMATDSGFDGCVSA